MFTQISLSLNSNNYLLKIDLNSTSINLLMTKKKEIEELKKRICGDQFLIDEYKGELFGFAFYDISHQDMLKKLSQISHYFKSNGFTVYDSKLATLSTRLEQLNFIDKNNQEIIDKLLVIN